MRFLLMLAILSMLGLTSACSGDPADVGVGSASAAITDNAHEVAAVRASDDATARVLMHGPFSGTLVSEGQVEISEDGGTWVAIGHPAEVAVTLQSHYEDTPVRSNIAVPAGTYSRARLTLTGAQAEIDAGSQVGGVSLTGAVTLTVGGSDGGSGSGGTVVIDEAVEPFTLTPDTHVHIRFDLNSEGWVTEENVAAGRVEAEDVRSSVRAARTIEDQSGPE